MFLVKRALLLMVGFALCLCALTAINNDAFAVLLASWNDQTQLNRRTELDAQLAESNQWRPVRKAIADKVIAEELTLAEATIKFRELHADDAVYLPRLRRVYPDVREDQLISRDVMGEVECRLGQGSMRWESVRVRLEREMEAEWTMNEKAPGAGI